MAPRHMPNGERHREYSKPEGKRDTNKADTKCWIAGRDHRRATASEHKPERAEHLGNGAFE